MIRGVREKIKSAVFLALALVCVIQIGFLWDYQNGGFPFFSGIIGKQSASGAIEDIDRLKDRIFVPARIMLTREPGEGHKVAVRGSDTAVNETYGKLWMDARLYLFAIIYGGGYDKPQTIPVEQWGSLVSSEPFAFSFNTDFDIGMLEFFFSSVKHISRNAPDRMSGMVISPWKDINGGNTIYINEGDRILQYILPFGDPKQSSHLSADDYRRILDDSFDSGGPTYRVFDEIDPGMKSSLPFSRDIPIITGSSGTREFGNLACGIPENLQVGITTAASAIGSGNTDDGTQKLDGIARLIAGADEIDNYDMPYMDENGTFIMKNLSNIYRLYKNGLLEYKYLSEQGESGQAGSADSLKQTLLFIRDRLSLSPGANIYISGIRRLSDKSAWEFTFDYSDANGTPVYFSRYRLSSGISIKTLNNALTIVANGKRILECWWFLRALSAGNGAGKINVRFDDLVNKAFEKYPELKTGKNLIIKDIYVAYCLRDLEAPRLAGLKPVLVLKASGAGTDTRYYTVDTD